MTEPKRWLRKSEALQLLGVSKTTLDQAVARGEIRKYYRPGSRLPLFDREELLAPPRPRPCTNGGAA